LQRFAGEDARPLIRSPEPAMNNHQQVLDLHRYFKPSRWRQPPRVTRNLQPQRSLNATRYNHLSKCTWNHSISLWIRNQVREMSERKCAQLTRMSRISKVQEGYLGADQTLFIDILKRIEPLDSALGSLCKDRTRQSR
jgi:hypothetical protein